MEKIKTTNLEETYILIAGRIFQAAAQIVLLRLLTIFLVPDEVGRYYIILGIITWLNWVLVNPVNMYILRNFIEWDVKGIAAERLVIFFKYLITASVISFVFIASLWILVGIGTRISFLWLFVLIIGNFFIGAIVNSCLTALNLLRHRIYFVFFTNLYVWIGLLLSFLFVRYISSNAEYWILGQLTGQIIIAIPSVLAISRYINKNKNIEFTLIEQHKFSFSSIFDFCWPIIIVVVLWWIQSQSYRYVLAGMNNGQSIVGIFSAAYAVSAGCMLIFESLWYQFYNPIFLNELIGKDGEGKVLVWNKYAKFYIPSTLIMGIYVVCCGPFLSNFFLGPNFQNLGLIIGIAAIIETIRIIGSSYNMGAFAQMNMKVLIQPYLIAAIISLLGVYLLRNWNPLLGSAISLALGMLASTVIAGKNVKKILNISLPVRQIFKSIAFMLPLILLVIVIGLSTIVISKYMALILSAAGLIYMGFIQVVINKELILSSRDSNV